MFSKRYQLVVAFAMFLAGIALAFFMSSQEPQYASPSTQVGGRPVPSQGEGLAATLPPALPSPAAFEGPDGKDVVLDDFQGQWVIVNFWATWCQPCIAEMPALGRMLETMGKDAPKFVAISIDAMGRAAAEPFAKSKGWTHVTAYADPKSDLYRSFASPGIPLTLIFDPEGREVARRLGPAKWDGEFVTGQIKRLMARQPIS
ncbi:MAG: TlpA family protein disulfide reductase [Methylocystis sp.]|nr:TlpA family protein disulfide reductase [Methylocystis sp.]